MELNADKVSKAFIMSFCIGCELFEWPHAYSEDVSLSEHFWSSYPDVDDNATFNTVLSFIYYADI